MREPPPTGGVGGGLGGGVGWPKAAVSGDTLLEGEENTMSCLLDFFTAHLFARAFPFRKPIVFCTDERKSYGTAFILQCVASGVAFLGAIFAICLACMLKKKKEKPIAQKEIVYPPPPVPVVSIPAPRQVHTWSGSA